MTSVQFVLSVSSWSEMSHSIFSTAVQHPFLDIILIHWGRNYFSILCLTTDPVHQGHERKKKNKSTAQHVRAATRSTKCERQWRHVSLATAGPIPVTNNMAAYQFSVSASYKQCVSDECTYNIQSRQKHNTLSLLHAARMLSLLHAASLKLLVFFFNFSTPSI